MRQQLPGKGPWIAACIALAPVLLFFGLGWSPIASGTWTCEVCGLNEQRRVLLDVPIWWDRARTPRGTYASWWATDVRTPHEHYWTRIGCHRRGSTITCTMRVEPLLAMLGEESAPTPEFRAAAIALARAQRAEQRELVTELFDAVLRRDPAGAERVPDIASLRARCPAWDEAIAAQRR